MAMRYLCPMKIVSLFIGLFLSVEVSAQFNTVELPRHLSRIDRAVTETTAPTAQSQDDREEIDTIAQLRTQLIRRYLSVSYPLKSIHISSPFGSRTDPFTGKTANHNGLDLRAPYGTEVYACMFGKVEAVSEDKRSGIYVKLRHGHYTISYCHLSQPLVRKGDYVAPGQVIALSGNTGRSTGPHLHLTLKYKSSPLRPAKTLDPTLLLDFIRTTQSEAVAHLRQLPDS